MARLQMEKILPFAAEEVTCGLMVVETRETESVVVVFTANNHKLESLCRPLIEKGIHPSKVSVFASHLAATVPDGYQFIIYRELEALVLAIAQGGKLIFAQAVDAADTDQFSGQLPALMLSIQMEGLPVDFSAVHVDAACADLESALESSLGAKIHKLLFPPFLNGQASQVMPLSWVEARKASVRSVLLKKRLKHVGVGYVVLFVLGFAYLVWLQFQMGAVEKQLLAIKPQTEFVEKLQRRWSALAPAIDPAQYPVEVLLQVYNCLPSEEVHLTKYTQTPDQFVLEGEAPTANSAIEYGERLKKNEALSRYTIEVGNPVILPNEHAQFRVFGKL